MENIRRCQSNYNNAWMHFCPDQAIATECGIYDPTYGIAMEGPEFRKMSPQQLDQILPRLQVLFFHPETFHVTRS